MKTIIYKNIDQNLINEWRSLWEKSAFATFANSPQWFLSVIETFGYKDFVINVFYEKEKMVGVAALIKQKKYGIASFTVAPQNFVCANPFLIDQNDKKCLRALAKNFEDLGTVYLSNIREEFITLLKQYTNDINAFPVTRNYYLELQKDETGKVIIRRKKRILRRSEEIEKDLSLHVFSGLDKDALETVFSIDNNSRKQEKGYNAFADVHVKNFYRSLAKHFGEKFVIFLLYHKKKPISFQIGFVIAKVFYASQIASLKEYEQYSIGRSLLIKVIEQLGTDGITIFDFGSGDDHVKRSLAKEYHIFNDTIIANNTLKKKYITNVSKIKNSLYHLLQDHIKKYTTYRKIKNSIHA